MFNNLKVSFVGHSTVLVEEKITYLTDPHLTNYAFFIKRSRQPGIPFEKLPKIDVIPISHVHYDHLNFPSLKLLSNANPHTLILAPVGTGKFLKREGLLNYVELDYGEKYTVEGVEFELTKARHVAYRLPAIFPTKCAGYMIRGEKNVYFTGDTAYWDYFKKELSKDRIDLALIQIGCYKPYFLNWFIHMNPKHGLKCYEDLRALNMIPIHWGTFRLALDTIDEPKEELLKLLKEKEYSGIKILENGGSVKY
ncbi:Beta-lactamase superfamily domain protein [uncultured archaeon]|nr:Beta-lactamase superfamily domain protein [uncultured archaeon]